MNFKIIYRLDISIDVYTKAAEKLKLQRYIDNPWIDYHHGNSDYEEEPSISISYPKINYPELTREIFFDLVCAAYPLSSYPSKMFVIEGIAKKEEKEAMRFTDVFSDFLGEQYQGNFRYNGECFAADLQDKIKRIKEIIHEL